MREAFKRSEELLDLELASTDPMLEQKQDMHAMIQDATPEEFSLMLEVFQNMMSTGKMGQFNNNGVANNVLLHATT